VIQSERQAELNRARLAVLTAVAPGGVGPPVRTMPDQSGENPLTSTVIPAPDITLRPVTPSGLRTRGFQFMFVPPTLGGGLIAAAGGFTVRVWEREPSTGYYGDAGVLAGVGYFDWCIHDDLNACELFFEITNTAESLIPRLIVCVVEQGFAP
jgi:hypothetical protein